MGRTRKPCPGCGEVDPQRSADDVCHSCNRKILAYDSLKNQLKVYSEQWCEVPPPLHRRPKHYDEGVENKICMNILCDLLENLPTNSDGVLMGPRGLCDNLQSLRNAIVEAMEKRYKEGRENGSNLLRRLHDGDTSVTNFESDRRQMTK